MACVFHFNETISLYVKVFLFNIHSIFIKDRGRKIELTENITIEQLYILLTHENKKEVNRQIEILLTSQSSDQ